MAVAMTSAQKTADLRIQRALAKPGAYGMKGLLLWTEAAWPPAIARKVIAAAGKYTPGATGQSTLASPQNGGFGRLGCARPLGFLGDSSSFLSDVSVSIPDISQSTTDAINAAASDPSVPPVSGVTQATASQPASNSWISDLSAAFTAAANTALTAVQLKDAQNIFNTNLQRAQQGLSPIPVNPTTYGLPAPTANIGLTSSTQNMLLIGAGVLAVALLAGGVAAGRR